MRPKYETKIDRAKQELVAKEVERHFGSMKCQQMPDSYRLDYLVINTLDQNAFAVAEVKCRDCYFDSYPTLILSLCKWVEGVRYFNAGFKFLLAFGLHDGVFIMHHHESMTLKTLTVKMGGRTCNRRDHADVEPVVHIPTTWLKKISDVNVHEAVKQLKGD